MPIRKPSALPVDPLIGCTVPASDLCFRTFPETPTRNPLFHRSRAVILSNSARSYTCSCERAQAIPYALRIFTKTLL